MDITAAGARLVRRSAASVIPRDVEATVVAAGELEARPSLIVNVVVEAPKPVAEALAPPSAPPREVYLPPQASPGERPSFVPPPLAAAAYADQARGQELVQPRVGLILDVRV